MYIIVSILSIWLFIKTIRYALFELLKQKNMLGGIIIILLAILTLIAPITIFIVNKAS